MDGKLKGEGGDWDIDESEGVVNEFLGDGRGKWVLGRWRGVNEFLGGGGGLMGSGDVEGVDVILGVEGG